MVNPIVIKYGGSLLENPGKQEIFLNQIAREWKLKKTPMVLVHGGGKEITRQMAESGLQAKFINGRRYTDDKIMDVVEKALQQLNVFIVNKLISLGVEAEGYSGRQNHWLEASAIKDLGRVGTPTHISMEPLMAILEKPILPVFYSVGEDSSRNSLNINADEFAQALAISCGASRLIFLTDSGGILNEKGELIPLITSGEVVDLIKNRIIKDGMIVKAQACIMALKSGVGKVIIGDQISSTATELDVHGTIFFS